MGKLKRKKELNIQTKVVKEQPPRTQDVREQILLASQNQTKGGKNDNQKQTNKKCVQLGKDRKVKTQQFSC